MLKLLTPLMISGLGLAVTAVSAPDTFDAKGVKLHYIIEGKGEPVVFIHGLHSSAVMNWQMPGIISSLSSHYQVIEIGDAGHINCIAKPQFKKEIEKRLMGYRQR